MEITQEVRDFTAKQNVIAETFLATEEAEERMARMSDLFIEKGTKLYL